MKKMKNPNRKVCIIFPIYVILITCYFYQCAGDFGEWGDLNGKTNQDTGNLIILIKLKVISFLGKKWL